MKKPYSVLIILIFASCQQHKENQAPSKMNSEVSPRMIMQAKLDKFSLPYDPALTDSNNLAFVYGARLDTAYFFHARKTLHNIRCTVSEIVPAFHRDMNDFADTERELPFFDGYSFKMEEREWNQLIDHTAGVLKEPEFCPTNGPGNDGPEFYFAYNNQVRMLAGFCEDSAYRNFAKYVKDSILRKFEQKRKPWIERN
jgi:hypothetical protein